MELRRGAVAFHVEHGSGSSNQVRPAVRLQLRRERKEWILQKFSVGLIFPHEPTEAGITLNWRQRAYFLWASAGTLQTPWVKV